jgi:hypothetical protein
MKTRMKRGKLFMEDEFEELEACLKSVMRPVEPRSAFISALKVRLLNNHTNKRITPRFLQYSALLVAGLISGVIIVVTGVRATIAILGALGLLRNVRGQVTRKSTASIQPLS